MKKLFILLIPITLIFLGGCSDDNSLYQNVYDLRNENSIINWEIDWIQSRLDNIENNILQTWIVEEDCWNEEYKWNIIFEQSLQYCHKHKDIKLWDNVYFAYLWNRNTDYLKNQEWIKTVIIDWQDWYYDIQPVVEILWEMVEGQNCITMINWYWTEPQKTYQDMIENIKYYIECSNKWCSE
jgi:hypothetical protein